MTHRPPGIKPLSIGIGATKELSLRVSVATLVRVLLENPDDGQLMLALERKATLLGNEDGRFVDIKVQPFGGAIRINNLNALQDSVGNFHFDSEQSRSERDFRIFIQPSSWELTRQFCLQHFGQANDPVLESDPRRELVEEFADALKMHLNASQFTYKTAGMMFENDPLPTENFYARGYPTVRVYRIFEARVLDGSLAHAMMRNSENYSNHDLQERALEDARTGGNGWANAVLNLPLTQVRAFYSATSAEDRNRPVLFQGHRLDETVAAILEDVPVPRYKNDSRGFA